MDLEPSRRRASLRASDADREHVVYVLRQHHGDGRLDVSEFTERMQIAFEAKTIGDLEALTKDLPRLPPPLPEDPRPDSASVVRWRFYRHLLSYAWVNGFMILLWLVTSIAAGRLIFFWPIWTLLGWGIAVGSHAIRTFGPHRLDRPRHDRRGGDSWDGRHDQGHGPDDDSQRRHPDDRRRRSRYSSTGNPRHQLDR
jgi:hypothetical protein